MEPSHAPRRRRNPTSSQRLLLVLAVVLVGVAFLAAQRGEGPGAAGPQNLLSAPPTPEPTPTPVTAPDRPDPPPTNPAGSTATAGPTPIPTSTGRFTYAGAGEAVGAAPHRRYAVAVENGLGLDAGVLAHFVDETLADERSWIGDTVTGFERVRQSDDVEFTIVVASPATVDELCAPLNTAGIYSCGNNGWIALNLDRWEGATDSWPADLETYRRYLVNHEVGHYVLGPDHATCPSPGALAPIMMQQTIDLAGCAPNGWVYPD